MDLGFKGKVALVTGAGSQIGFGKAIALLFAKEGCDTVAVTDMLKQYFGYPAADTPERKILDQLYQFLHPSR